MEASETRRVLTVAQVNRLVSGMLAERFSDIWIEGEVSNFKSYPSGHLYFALKDAESQIAAVCFKPNARRLRFEMEDGLAVIAHGKLDVYAANGKYQIILDTIEPKGLGALQKAFEQLKRKLEQEGLFATERKRPLPALPRTVGIVTSPKGAVVHDMLRTMRLHKAHVRVLLFPAMVQGEGAAGQIAEGVAALNARPGVDVIIVGRGGGSTEDLWAFNEEPVARAIAGSRVPVISAVGHEVDFTIADFVADVRAATPTAAAQLVAAPWEALDARLSEQAIGLLEAWQQAALAREQQLDELIRHRGFDQVAGRFAAVGHRAELLLTAIESSVRARLRDGLARSHGLADRLNRQNPVARVLGQRIRLQQLSGRLGRSEREHYRKRVERLRALIGRVEPPVQALYKTRDKALAEAGAKLHALSPLASLGRGYSICQAADGAIVQKVAQVSAGDGITVMVSDGRFDARVTDERGQSARRPKTAGRKPDPSGGTLFDSDTTPGEG